MNIYAKLLTPMRMNNSFANNHKLLRKMSASRHMKFKRFIYAFMAKFLNTPICDNVINKNCHLFIFSSSFNICTVILKLFHTTNSLITGLIICIISLFSCLCPTPILTSLRFVFVHLSLSSDLNGFYCLKIMLK